MSTLKLNEKDILGILEGLELEKKAALRRGDEAQAETCRSIQKKLVIEFSLN